MFKLKTHVLLFVLLAAMMGMHASAQQADRTITIRMLDSKTGNPIPPTKFQVTVNTKDYSHLESISPNKDGVGELVVEGDITQLSIEAYYDSTEHTFVNCDTVKDKIFFQTHWYAIPEIFSAGIVAPNKCSKLTAVAKPGEFVFFVRPTNWYEKLTK